MKGVAAIVLAACTLASPARAQLGRALGDPSAGASTHSETRESIGRELGDPTRLLAEPPEREPAWPGPQVQLAYVFYRVSDGYGGGDTHTAQLEAFIQLPVPEIRLGVLGELGARDYSLGGDDFIARGGLEIGVQLVSMIEPLVPYASLLVSFGGVVGQRFATTVAHAFGGAGLAIGADLRIVRNFHIGVQGSYQRWEMDGAAFDVFMIRLGAGF